MKPRWYTLENDAELDDLHSDVARAIYELAAHVGDVARALRSLGMGDGMTQVGALEGFAMLVRDGLASVREAIDDRQDR